MVGMPLLNLGYALGGLSQGYNTAQQQAMQRAVQQLALQQAQSQQNAQRLAAQGLAAGLLGKGGGLGGFNPANINPISQPAPAPIPGVTTPSQTPAPPYFQQPPIPDSPRQAPATDYRPMTPQQWSAADPDTQVRDAVLTEEGVTATSEDKPPGQSGTSAPPVTTTPDTKPAPGPASDATPSSTTPSTTAPASTTSDAPAGAGGGGYAVQIPGGPTIPISQFFDTIDYGHLAQGIAKLAPPGTDQADIYQAVVDLSKLAEGNKTQQQQAGLLMRELLGQNFKVVQQSRSIEARHEDVRTQQAGATGRTELQQAGAGERTREQITSREKIATANRESRELAQTASRNLRSQQLQINSDRERRLADKQVADLERAAENLGLNYQKAQLSAIRARISTFKPGPTGAFDANQQKQLAALNAQAAAIGEQIAAQAATAAPAQQ